MPDQNGKETSADRLELAYATIKPYIAALRNLEPILSDLVADINQVRYGSVGKPKDDKKGEVYGTHNPKERDDFIKKQSGAIEGAVGTPLNESSFERLLQAMTTGSNLSHPGSPEDAMREWMRVIKAVMG